MTKQFEKKERKRNDKIYPRINRNRLFTLTSFVVNTIYDYNAFSSLI